MTTNTRKEPVVFHSPHDVHVQEWRDHKKREALAAQQRELSAAWQQLKELEIARRAENREYAQEVLQTKLAVLQEKLEPAPLPRSYPEPIASDLEPVETQEQRQDRRLQACINVGLNFDNYKGRLPNGVGVVAIAEGISRQSLSDDVKAALKRRFSPKIEGSTLHRIR